LAGTEDRLAALDVEEKPVELHPVRETGARDKRRERLERAGDTASREALSEATRSAQSVTPVEASSRTGEITVYLRGSGEARSAPQTGEEGSRLNASYGEAAGSAFSEALAGELRNGLESGIVREARFVLGEGGEGQIRLSLKPESLGNVKIRLELAENKVSGKVIVESDDAFRAFEQEIHNLEQAFLDSGFEGASLELSAGSDGRQDQGEEAARPWFSARLSGRLTAQAAAGYEAQGEAGYGAYAVNFLV
jgi:flagellar hook-length control protein FliK